MLIDIPTVHTKTELYLYLVVQAELATLMEYIAEEPKDIDKISKQLLLLYNKYGNLIEEHFNEEQRRNTENDTEIGASEQGANSETV